MKKILLMVLISITCWSMSKAQVVVSIASPAGLTEPPYEVAIGTEVTFRWKSRGNEAPTTFFSNPEFPGDMGEYTVSPNPAWKTYSNFIDNHDGTFDFKIKITEPTYIWGGLKTGGGAGFSYWSYSEVFEIGIASGVTISLTDGFVCPDGSNPEQLQVAQTYASYQWYRDGEAIEGASSATYSATEAGQYKVQVPLNGTPVFSNSVRLKTADVTFAGTLAGTKLNLQATPGLTSYQWLSGTSESSLNVIGGANTATRQATVSTAKVYYAVRAQQAGCTVQSIARPASTAIFTAPVMTVNATENEFNVICSGSTVSLSVPETFGTYAWYNNGELVTEGITSLYIGESGSYNAVVTATEWPEIPLASNIEDVDFYTLEEPAVTGPTALLHCPGEELTVTLTDVGYEYTWYKSVNGAEPEEIQPENSSYTFTFEGPTNIKITARDLGCEVTRYHSIQSYGGQQFGLTTSNGSSEYYCPGQSMQLLPAEDISATHDTFQWYTLTNGVYKILNGKTALTYTVTAAGTYVLRAHAKACDASVIIESFPYTVQDNSSRTIFIETDKTTLCEGEKATLSIPAEWKDIQWFEKSVAHSSDGHGHAAIYVPLSNAGSGNTTQVGKFTTYQVRARHESCSAGVKAVSEPLQILPTVNPDISIEPAIEIMRWVIAPYDSIPDAVFCGNSSITLSIPEGYNSYKWYKGTYDGSGVYELGTEVADNATRELSFIPMVNWVTAKVEQDGCVGYSRPVLIDTYAHSSPAVASYNNAEFCEEGDSIMLNSAFVSNWEKYVWYRDGEPVPDSDNDTIFVKEVGSYNVTAFPKECPTIGYSSGTPVYVRFMPTPFVAENDTVYFAALEMVTGGAYNIKWIVDGEPFEPAGEEKGFIYKSALSTGSHTLQVELINPIECSRLSEPYTSSITGLPGELADAFRVFPNPTKGSFSVRGINEREIDHLKLYNIQGIAVKQATSLSADGSLDLSSSPAGVYILEVVLKNGTTVKTRVVRQ